MLFLDTRYDRRIVSDIEPKKEDVVNLLMRVTCANKFDYFLEQKN